MGLDIVVWTNVEKCEPGDDNFQAFTYPEFIARLSPLEAGQYYKGKRAMEFRAGSYSGYNAVRAAFCKLATNMSTKDFWALGEEEAVKKPLGELLNFADNEGIIGTDACKRLAEQFEALHERAMQELDDWNRARFEEWEQAFRLAADNNGAIMFC